MAGGPADEAEERRNADSLPTVVLVNKTHHGVAQSFGLFLGLIS